MARATRSAATTTTPAENSKPADSPPSSRKGASKKRKRNSNVENGDSPPAKHARTDGKEDSSPQPEAQVDDSKGVELPSSGDVPIQDADAVNILEVLELVDNQGLLDRVFPLPTQSDEAASSESSANPPTMHSFRSLLKASSQYPLSVLRAAIKHLYPISSHPRSRPSEPAVQQLRFCNLANSLLDQASRNNTPVPLHVESLTGEGEPQDSEDVATSSQTSSSGLKPRKYALVQHLPTGDWWTSASAGVPAAEGKEPDWKSLSTAKAELVAVFPTPSGSDLASKHTLGDYVTKKPPGTTRYKAAPPRRVSCGKFLYYGPYASFAPCFDQDGVEVGRIAMGEVILQQEMRRRLRALAKGKRRAFVGASEATAEDVTMQDASNEDSAESTEKKADLAKGLEALLPPEDVEAIKSSLTTLELEQAVDELLQRNAKALQRLEELQLARFHEQGEGSSIVEVGSEEWDVAQGILDSLAILASLRPRPSNDDSEQSPIVPPPSVLHKLQRTLPISATEGWYGTLPEGRTTAFRDDTTVHVRSSAAASRTATATAQATPAVPTTPAAKTAAPSTVPPYTPYAYSSSYQNSQYRGGYGTYNPTQSGGYYPNYAQPAQAGTGSHYPNAQYATAGQSGYAAYSPWYGYQSQAGTTTPGRATPQPGTAGTTGYSGYYAAQGQQAAQATPQRAVANTVMSTAKPYQPGVGWGAGTAVATAAAGATGGYVAPTLPPHMRSAAATPSGTPPPATAATASGYGYYGGYQAPR
ncbi:hypothetical protein GY45DRAFT_1316332 [Cubamyces sp. BRFM 1775]|nr:hypothetical protein GY45DRAFT_1316332 [Cubamyces sp. BRFM 1775]